MIRPGFPTRMENHEPSVAANYRGFFVSSRGSISRARGGCGKGGSKAGRLCCFVRDVVPLLFC